MKKKSNENEKNNINDIKINLDDITTFLYKTGFLNKEINNRDKLYILKGDNKYNIVNNFEFNTSITLKEASSIYSGILKSIKSILNVQSNYNLETLYLQYLEYAESNMTLNNFLNCLIMLNFILTNFKEILNIGENDDFINVFQLNKKILIFSIDKINDNNEEGSLAYKLNMIYEKIDKNPEYKGNKVSKELIILIYVISLDGQILVEEESPNLLNLLIKFNLYNKIYISNIYLSLVLYIEIALLFDIYINSIKNKKNYFSQNKIRFQEFSRNEPVKTKNSNFTFTRHNNASRFNHKTQLLSTNRKLNPNNNKNGNEIKNSIKNEEISNYYLFNNEIGKNNANGALNIILFQNYLKYFSFYLLSKNKIEYEINLSFESINYFFKIFSNDTNNKNFFEANKDDISNKLNLDCNDLLTKVNIALIFSSFNINELIIKFSAFKSKSQIEILNFIYIDIIAKSNICYFQEPVDNIINDKPDEKSKGNKNTTSLTIKDLFTQFDILCFYLIIFHKHNEIQKTPKSIIIKFKAFKCLLNRENKKIQIYFNFSFIKEKTLFHYLKISYNILNIEEKYTDVLAILKEYKQYDSSIRICQNNFRSNQVSFIFTLLIKRICNFVEEYKLEQRINILEKKFNNFNPNLQVYIKDENMKFKNKILAVKQIINYPKFDNKFYVLSNYLEDLPVLWNLIVISDKETDFKLLRTFEDNKIFFYLARDLSNVNQTSENNSNSKNNSKQKSNNNGIEYINVIMYFKNDENIFSKGMSFIEELASDKDSILEYKFTLICDRFFLETNILMEPKMKKNVKIMYSLVDDLFLIAKNIKNENDINENENDQENEYYNYDIFIADSFIAVANYHIYDIKEDQKYNKIIFEFLSILSSCIEFILYILKNKDIYIPKFIYVLRTKMDNYYIFEYKESNMFIKKVKEFNSLISLDTKDCYPLFCFLSKKEQTKYTVSNDNFYDVFLRLFLNLNKVVESQERLNEVFLHKIHKNIFYEYYDSFILIAFSFEAINFFNDFFIKNDYLKITNGEKFDKSYIILTDDIAKRKKNYEILLKNMNNENNIIIKKLIIFNFNFNTSYFFINKVYSYMGFHKAEFLINEQISQVKSKNIPDLNINLNALHKIFENKTNSKEISNKIVERVKFFMFGNKDISIYNSNNKVYERILDEYIKEKNKMKAQKVEMRVYQLTEEAKKTQNSLQNGKKDCIIF